MTLPMAVYLKYIPAEHTMALYSESDDLNSENRLAVTNYAAMVL